MRYCENWDEIKQRHLEFWAKENHDRPLICVTAPKDRRITKSLPPFDTLKGRWHSIEYMLESAHLEFQNTYYGGEAFPALNPNLGPDLFAACYGAELEFGEETSWARHFLTEEDAADYQKLVFDHSSVYYQSIVAMTKAAVEDSQGQYLVGMTDLHPGADALAAMRGPQGLCFDTMDYPSFLRRGTRDLFDGFCSLYQELYEITSACQDGSTNWMGIWHPGRWYPTSCDFCGMISEDMFDELILPELSMEIEYLDASIFHLDGPAALKHLDRLLQIDSLAGIQWVYGEGQPTASHWLDVLKKIQDAGKCIQVEATTVELPQMLSELRPEGVMYTVHAATEQEAKEVMRMAEQWQGGRQMFGT